MGKVCHRQIRLNLPIWTGSKHQTLLSCPPFGAKVETNTLLQSLLNVAWRPEWTPRVRTWRRQLGRRLLPRPSKWASEPILRPWPPPRPRPLGFWTLWSGLIIGQPTTSVGPMAWADGSSPDRPNQFRALWGRGDDSSDDLSSQ